MKRYTERLWSIWKKGCSLTKMTDTTKVVQKWLGMKLNQRCIHRTCRDVMPDFFLILNSTLRPMRKKHDKKYLEEIEVEWQQVEEEIMLINLEIIIINKKKTEGECFCLINVRLKNTLGESTWAADGGKEGEKQYCFWIYPNIYLKFYI